MEGWGWCWESQCSVFPKEEKGVQHLSSFFEHPPPPPPFFLFWRKHCSVPHWISELKGDVGDSSRLRCLLNKTDTRVGYTLVFEWSVCTRFTLEIYPFPECSTGKHGVNVVYLCSANYLILLSHIVCLYTTLEIRTFKKRRMWCISGYCECIISQHYVQLFTTLFKSGFSVCSPFFRCLSLMKFSTELNC